MVLELSSLQYCITVMLWLFCISSAPLCFNFCTEHVLITHRFQSHWPGRSSPKRAIMCRVRNYYTTTTVESLKVGTIILVKKCISWKSRTKFRKWLALKTNRTWNELLCYIHCSHFYSFLSVQCNAMHGQNINLPMCVGVCVCVFVALSVDSPTGQTPQRIFTVLQF